MHIKQQRRIPLIQGSPPPPSFIKRMISLTFYRGITRVGIKTGEFAVGCREENVWDPYRIIHRQFSIRSLVNLRLASQINRLYTIDKWYVDLFGFLFTFGIITFCWTCYQIFYWKQKLTVKLLNVYGFYWTLSTHVSLEGWKKKMIPPFFDPCLHCVKCFLAVVASNFLYSFGRENWTREQSTTGYH